jgi:hypothetical protein
MKKQYHKPAMQVVELQHHTRLLQSSRDQWLNYAPGQPGTDGMNKLA